MGEKKSKLFIWGIVILCLEIIGVITYILLRLNDPGGIPLGFIFLVFFVSVCVFGLSIAGTIISVKMFIKKNKRKIAITLFAVSFIILMIVIVFVVNEVVSTNKGAKIREQERIDDEAYALQRYGELKEELKVEQVVVEIHNQGHIELENNKIIRLSGTTGKVTEEVAYFINFSRTNIVGEKVLVVIPEKEDFLEIYSKGEENDFFGADVYFNGKSLRGLLNGTYTEEDFLINMI
jgi:hypothetical protein